MMRTRNLYIVGLVLILLVSMLTACQTKQEGQAGADAAATSPGSQAPAAPQSTEAKTTHMYKDATGAEIEVPSNPKHLVAIQYVGDLLALGVKPQATTAYNLNSYPLELAGVENIGDRPVNREKLLSLQPDLIITDDLDDKSDLEQLTKVAPTVSLEFWLNEPFAHLHSVAEVLGKQKEAQAWLDAYNQEVQATKERIKPYVKDGETALLLIVSEKDLGVSGVRNGGYTLYKQLGFLPPPKLKALIDKEPNFGFETISLESLPDFAADHLFIELDNDSEVTRQTAEELQESPIWKNLLAYKNKQVYTVRNIWGLGDATSMKEQLREAAEQIAK